MARTAAVVIGILAATAAVAALAPGTAAADDDGFYLSEGLGVNRFADELDDVAGDDALHVRGALGYRVGHVGVELWVQGALPLAAHGQPEPGIGTRPGARGSTDGLATYGVDVKFVQPISSILDAYARTGLSRMQLGDYDGNGIGAAAGLSIGGDVPALGFLWWPLFFTNAGPKVHTALWLEANTSFHRVHADGFSSIDARMSGWTLGLSVGQGF
jgi:hypothetical protein